MTRIAFGTSGWRGILCEDFTFDNVARVSQATARNLTANLFLIGRNGMHRYNNQDHSMLTAMITVV